VANGLQQDIRSALEQARKARDRHRTIVLTTVLSEIRNREIDTGRDADDEIVTEVLARGIKQRRDSVDQMRRGGREDLALKEESEAKILAEFLPPPLGEEDVRVLVRDLIGEGAMNLGAVMGKLMPTIRGRFDGKLASQIVREELAS
jgi:uncharacterized protein YqeY